MTAGGGVCELVVYPGVGHLLTRNLANQEDDFDPDPAARDDGNARQRVFLERLWVRSPGASATSPDSNSVVAAARAPWRVHRQDCTLGGIVGASVM